MADLSGYSDDELMQIAGVGGGGDVSSMSDEELYRIAGVSPSTKTSPTWGQSAAFVGKSLAEGVGETVDFLNYINPFSMTSFGRMPQPSAKEAIQKIVGTPEDTGVVGPFADVVRAGVKATTLPVGGAIGNALAGVGGEIAHQMYPDSSVAPIVGALLAGGGSSIVGRGTERSANYLGDVADDVGRKLELSAYGAGKSRINKAIARMPDALDEQGKFNNPISEALKGFRAERTTKGLDAQQLLKDLEAQQGGYLEDLKLALSGAEESQVDAIIPEFTLTNRYVEGLAGTNKAKGIKIAQEEIENTINNTDGTLTGLQSEKEKLSAAIKDTAWGSDAEGQLRSNILKRVRADLRASIEDSYQALSGDSSQTVANLNRNIGQRESLYPLFNDMLASNEARNPMGWLWQNMRTSGGAGAAGVALAAGGNSALVSTGVPLAMALGMTPTGRLAISDALRGGMVQGPTSAVAALGRAMDGVPGAVSQPIMNAGSRLPQEAPELEEKKSSAPFASAKAAPTSSTDQPKSFKSKIDDALNRAEAKMSKATKGITDKTPVKDVERAIDAVPYYAALYETESGRNPNAKNPKSTAGGGFQFIDATARSMGLKDKFNLGESFVKVDELTDQHRARFGEDPKKLYAAHFLGATLLDKYLKGKRLTEKERRLVDELEQKALPRFTRIYDKVSARNRTVEA